MSEIFPVEVRAKAIAVFFAIAQSFGAFGPWLYGQLIGNGQDHFKLFIGYLIGAGVMIVGAVVEIFLGVDAEQKSLEDIALPLGAKGRPGTMASITGAPRAPAAQVIPSVPGPTLAEEMEERQRRRVGAGEETAPRLLTGDAVQCEAQALTAGCRRPFSLRTSRQSCSRTARASSSSTTWAAARFSSRCRSDDVPGMSSTVGA